MTKPLTLVLLLFATAIQPLRAQGLSEHVRLASAYDAIMRAQFPEAERRLSSACPPAPAESCLVLRTALLWWQIQIDPDSRHLDGVLEEEAQKAIAATKAWTAREPQRAEAWFYRAGALAPLAQWRILRGARLAAARDARTMKEALERALSLDPALHDAYFGIGLYHYYADVAPAALRFLRMLLLMPGGDRELGMREMLQARERGVLLAGEADYQLHWLNLWYEHDVDRALGLLRSLDVRYPSNPLFLQRIAEVQRNYRHDRDAEIGAWTALLDRVESTAMPAAADGIARLGLAAAILDGNGDSRRVVETLLPLTTRAAQSPYGAHARADLLLARAYERLNDRTQAIASLERAISDAPRDDPRGIRSRARRELSRVRAALH